MLDAQNAMLMVIDIQGKLAQSMHDKETLFDSARRIVLGANALGIPVVCTEQNPAGLGPTLPEIGSLIETKPVVKFAFSCWAEPEVVRALAALNRKQVLLVGIETHVCICQTALAMLKVGYEVSVVADAVSSRTARNREIGLQRMRDAGVAVTSVEMALFELLKTAKAPQFKKILEIVK